MMYNIASFTFKSKTKKKKVVDISIAPSGGSQVLQLDRFLFLCPGLWAETGYMLPAGVSLCSWIRWMNRGALTDYEGISFCYFWCPEVCQLHNAKMRLSEGVCQCAEL